MSRYFAVLCVSLMFLRAPLCRHGPNSFMCNNIGDGWLYDLLRTLVRGHGGRSTFLVCPFIQKKLQISGVCHARDRTFFYAVTTTHTNFSRTPLSRPSTVDGSPSFSYDHGPTQSVACVYIYICMYLVYRTSAMARLAWAHFRSFRAIDYYFCVGTTALVRSIL